MSNTVKKLLVASSIFFIFAGGTYGGLYYMIYSEAGEVVAVEDSISRALAREQALINAQTILINTESERERLDSFFVSSDGVVSFLEEIEKLGDLTKAEITVSQVEIVPVGNGGENQEELFEELLLTIQAEGAFSEVAHTLSVIEGLPLYVQVKQLSLSQTLSEEEGSAWRALMIFSVTKLQE